MRKISGMLLGAGVGTTMAYVLHRGLRPAFERTLNDGALVEALSLATGPAAGGIIGAVVGVYVANRFGRGIGSDDALRTRFVVGGLGGGLSGAIIGTIMTAVAGAIFMIIVGLTMESAMNESMGGALGGFIVGFMFGAVGGLIIGSLSGFIVGAVMDVYTEAPGPPKPDFIIPAAARTYSRRSSRSKL